MVGAFGFIGITLTEHRLDAHNYKIEIRALFHGYFTHFSPHYGFYTHLDWIENHFKLDCG